MSDRPKMKITIEPTEQFFMAGDVMVRAWEGEATHDDGSREPVVALIALIRLGGPDVAHPIGLVSIPPPTAAEAKQWAEKVLSGGVDYK